MHLISKQPELLSSAVEHFSMQTLEFCLQFPGSIRGYCYAIGLLMYSLLIIDTCVWGWGCVCVCLFL